MQPAARLAAAIELLAEIGAGGEAADRVVDRYFRNRRYAGKQDRAAINGLVWYAIRRETALPWLLDTALTPRLAAMAAAVLTGFADGATVDQWCNGEGHAPAALDEGERAALHHLTLDRPAPDWVLGDYPEDIGPLLQRRFGARLPAVVAAMAGRAPLDLRVNSLKAGRDAVLEELRGLGLEVTPSPLSATGIRVAGRERLGQLAPFNEGRVEVQDEGSQLVALAMAAAPGQAIADFCAGAGGKTLALAAEMQGRGRLLALDIDGFRLKRMEPRLARAGVADFVEREALTAELLAREAGRFDAVLVDAPCSLSGTWRRNPQARKMATVARVAELAALQGRILDQAATLVRPGGRLVYATCSVFIEEDEAVVEDFLSRNTRFAPGDHTDRLPGLAAGRFGLALDPEAQGTDGFFLAVLIRAA